MIYKQGSPWFLQEVGPYIGLVFYLFYLFIYFCAHEGISLVLVKGSHKNVLKDHTLKFHIILLYEWGTLF